MEDPMERLSKSEGGYEPLYTVSLSQNELRVVRRILASFARPIQSAGQSQGSPSAGTEGEPDLVNVARKIFENRRQRKLHFNPAMFGEPAWDMLLGLYVSDDAGAATSIADLKKFSGTPATTSLRWLSYLEKEKLVSREEHPWDRRATILRVTEKGCKALEAYLARIG
jgi:DNA-binding MarR family transcriptional regulator